MSDQYGEFMRNELNFKPQDNDVERDPLAGEASVVVRRPGQPFARSEVVALARGAGREVETSVDYPDVLMLRGGLDSEVAERVLGAGCVVAHERGSLDLPWVPGGWLRRG